MCVCVHMNVHVDFALYLNYLQPRKKHKMLVCEYIQQQTADLFQKEPKNVIEKSLQN